MTEDIEALITELRENSTAARREGLSLTADRYALAADALEAVYADSLTGQRMHAHWQERAEWHATQEAGLRGDVETLERERDEALQRVTELEALIAEALRPDARYVTAQGREARMHAILSSSPSSAGRVAVPRRRYPPCTEPASL